mgnify:CR=1 FL=1
MPATSPAASCPACPHDPVCPRWETCAGYQAHRTCRRSPTASWHVAHRRGLADPYRTTGTLASHAQARRRAAHLRAKGWQVVVELTGRLPDESGANVGQPDGQRLTPGDLLGTLRA